MIMRTLKHSVITHIRIIPVFFLALACMTSCEVINPAEPVPSYIHLDSVSLKTTYITEGSALSNVSDAWIYVD